MKVISIKDLYERIDELIQTLENGGLVIFPTETAYGIAADATNPEAVSKLLKYKQRPIGKAISIAVDSKEMASKYIEINPTAEKIINTFLPGPVTVVAKSKKNVDQRLEDESGTIGIRIPNYKAILDLVSKFGKPFTATSANLSGGKTPYSVSDITDAWTDKKEDLIDIIIDGGVLPKNPPSTVIDTTTDDLKVYRQGRIDPREMFGFDSKITNNVEETERFGEELILKMKESAGDNPIIVLLNGELGAGKTHLTKGIGKALGVSQVIKSPTYNYVSEYKLTNHMMYHFDAWRIGAKEDLEALRFYEWFKNNNTIVIEWPSVVMALDEKFFENMSFYYVDFVILGEEKREIKVYKK